MFPPLQKKAGEAGGIQCLSPTHPLFTTFEDGLVKIYSEFSHADAVFCEQKLPIS